MRVSIIGAGYVGLVTGACLAEKGHPVVCVDKDELKIRAISEGVTPMFEVGLESLIQKNIGVNLFATTDVNSSVSKSEITFVTVGTPFKESGIDLRFIKKAAIEIGKVLKKKKSYHLVVIKSTVVPGTTDDVITPILEKASGKKVGIEFGVSMNPEFLTEGQAVADFMFPDRIIIGSNDEQSYDTLAQLYSTFSNVPMFRTNNKTAEMIKYASNAMLATSISFTNEIANLCSALGGIDAKDVMKGVHLSRYLRPRSAMGEYVQAPLSSFFEAGCGYGGSCLPKDMKALVAHGERAGAQTSLLRAAIRINEQQPKKMIEILKRYFPSLCGLPVSVLGLAFKPDTDDMRESPAIPIIRHLQKEGARILAYDPVAIPNAKRIFGNKEIHFMNSLSQATKNVKAILIVTKWREFEKLPRILRESQTQPLVIDGRRILDKTSIVNYAGIGL